MPQQLKPGALEPVLCNKRSHSNENPAPCNEEYLPHYNQRKSPHSNEDPTQPLINKSDYIKKSIHGPKTKSSWMAPKNLESCSCTRSLLSEKPRENAHTFTTAQVLAEASPLRKGGRDNGRGGTEGQQVKDNTISFAPLSWPGSATCIWHKYNLPANQEKWMEK